MATRSIGFIGAKEAAYIDALLGHPEPAGKEAALERICRLYRRGYRLRDPHSICQSLSGMLYLPYPSVRRWVFNAIALVGNRAQNLDAVVDAISRDRADDDIFAAGMAALVGLTDNRDIDVQLSRIGVELEGAALLAAAQQAPVYAGRLAAQRLDIDRASPSELRLAAILIGLEKAPDHLFSLSHANEIIIGELNCHPDTKVAQYSTWAISENPNLGLKHLGIRLDDISSLPPDVKKYVFRILTTGDGTAEKYRDLIAEGSEDLSETVREGLAIGLSNAYFDGLENVVLDWLAREPGTSTHDALLDHIVAQAARSSLYEVKAKEHYLHAGRGSMVRARMEAVAEGKPIFADFRRIDIEADTFDLFGIGAIGVTNYNINANSIGMVAGDNATMHGGINMMVSQPKQAQDQLARLLQLLDQAGSEPGIAKGRSLANEAAAKPTKGAVAKVVEWMKALTQVADSGVAIEHDFGSIIDGLVAAIGHAADL